MERMLSKTYGRQCKGQLELSYLKRLYPINTVAAWALAPSVADPHCRTIRSNKKSFNAARADWFLFATVPLPEISVLHFQRQRFNVARADRSGLKLALGCVDWSQFRRGNVDDAASFFMEMF